MNERIKKLRKALGLTQQKFADEIGVKQNTVAQYEIGRNPPTDTVISLICLEFRVNEEWLRTGEGEMFIQLSRDEELAAFFGDLLAGEPDFKQRLMSVLARLSEDEWALLEKMAESLASEMQKDGDGQ